MGRIAEALKRAQEERARRSGGADSAVALAEPSWAGPAPVESWPTSGPAGSTAAPRTGPILDPYTAPREFAPVVPPIPQTQIGEAVLAVHEPTSIVAERFRSVRTRLLTGNPGGSPRILAMTSSLSGEGKSVTCANLGFSLAELRHVRVAMVDFDLRRHGLSTLLGAADRPGLIEVLKGEKSLAEVCVPVVRENLYLIPSGKLGSDRASDLLAGDGLQRIFREINDRFHYSLVDTPAMQACADIGLLAPLCHSVLMVIRMNRTPEHVLRRCVKMLQANHVTIAGCILAGDCDETMSSQGGQDYYTNNGG